MAASAQTMIRNASPAGLTVNGGSCLRRLSNPTVAAPCTVAAAISGSNRMTSHTPGVPPPAEGPGTVPAASSTEPTSMRIPADVSPATANSTAMPTTRSAPRRGVRLRTEDSTMTDASISPAVQGHHPPASASPAAPMMVSAAYTANTPTRIRRMAMVGDGGLPWARDPRVRSRASMTGLRSRRWPAGALLRRSGSDVAIMRSAASCQGCTGRVRAPATAVRMACTSGPCGWLVMTAMVTGPCPGTAAAAATVAAMRCMVDGSALPAGSDGGRLAADGVRPASGWRRGCPSGVTAASNRKAEVWSFATWVPSVTTRRSVAGMDGSNCCARMTCPSNPRSPAARSTVVSRTMISVTRVSRPLSRVISMPRCALCRQAMRFGESPGV